MFENRRQRIGVERLIGDHSVDAVDELRREFLAHRRQPDRLQFTRQVQLLFFDSGLKSEIGIDLLEHLPRAQVAGQEHQALFEIHGSVVAQPERGFVEHPQQKPRHGGSRFFDFVEQHDRQRAFFAGHRSQLLLREDGLRFAVAEITGRSPDQLGHLVLHLELAAIHLQQTFLAAVKDLRQGFNGLGLPSTRGAQQQENSHRPPFRSQACLEHLDVGNNDVTDRWLPHYLVRQLRRQIFSLILRRFS